MIDPEIYENLKCAVELGRWADGQKLTAEQKELCLQAIIAYDITYKEESLRTGSIATPVTCGSYEGVDNSTGTGNPEPIKLPPH
jgi:hypothetical protein